MPPAFWATATSLLNIAIRTAPAAAAQFLVIISGASLGLSLAWPTLLVEPDVFHAIAIVDAVHHRHEPRDIGLRTGAAARIEDDRPRPFLGQPPFDIPHQPLALVAVGLGRLLLDQLVDLGIAIAGVIAYRSAHEILVELLVGIVDAAFGAVDSDRVVLAVDLGEPVRGLDWLKLGVDIDLLQLIDQDHRRLPVGG